MDNPFPSDYISEKKKRDIPYINILLFIATLLSTLVAGAMQQGVNPLEEPELIWKGVPFSFTLLLILGTHEFGHYFLSRRHNIDVTLPYFIPAPSLIGTFGAVIKMKSPILDRRTLLDIGVAGPLAGMVVAVPVLVIGLTFSKVVPYAGESGIRLGSCILFTFLNWVIHGSLPENSSLILHPMAFSGWIGLLVTSLNLLPVGQLDGGHVAYSVFGARQNVIAKVIMVVLLVLGLVSWKGWLVWFILLLFLGFRHPPVVYDWMPLDRKRKIVGWITLIVFVITFMPAPF